MLEGTPSPFRVALTMARKSQSKYKIGACLVKGRRIISAGYNQTKSHPLLRKLKNPYITGLHAEMHASIGVEAEILVGCSIYVVRLRRDGHQGLARPCKECQNFLSQAGIRKAYYTETYRGFNWMRL